MPFEFEDLRNLYDRHLESDPQAYKNISAILVEAEALYVQEKLNEGFTGDMGQSWRSWKGQNFEKLVFYILSRIIDEAGIPLKLIRGSTLEYQQIDAELCKVKLNILVDFGVHGCFVPDADIVVYDPSDASVKAIISCKTSLRERIAQTGFWKLKLRASPITRHIKAFFITPDEDDTLVSEKINKSKAIVLSELDAAYVLNENLVEHHNLRNIEWIKEDLQGL